MVGLTNTYTYILHIIYNIIYIYIYIYIIKDSMSSCNIKDSMSSCNIKDSGLCYIKDSL